MTTTTGSKRGDGAIDADQGGQQRDQAHRQQQKARPAFFARTADENCPAQAVTPVTSSPELTTKSDAMKMTAGSPKPPSAWSIVSTPVAHSANAVAMATTTTGSLFQTNRTTATAMMVAVYAIGLNRSVPHLALIGLSNPVGRASHATSDGLA